MTPHISPPPCIHRLAPLAFLLVAAAVRADAPPASADGAAARDRMVLAEVKADCEAVANLTYLCDEIGPRPRADYFFGASSAGGSSESGTSPRIILLAAPTSFK